jgi:hypothetical protein
MQAAAMTDLKSGPVSGTAITEIAVTRSSGSISSLSFGLGRAATELLQLGGIALQPYDPSDPETTTTIAQAWSVAPTVPAQFHRRVFDVQAIGFSMIWTFPRGLRLATSQSMVLWLLTGNATVQSFSVSYEVDE